MYWNYEDFLESVQRGTFRTYYRNFSEALGELYDFENAKGIYIKRHSKTDGEEKGSVYFFFEHSIVVITKKDLHFHVKEFKAKVISKELIISKDMFRQTTLKLNLENDDVISFDNHRDSFSDEYDEYSKDIKEIFKFY